MLADGLVVSGLLNKAGVLTALFVVALLALSVLAQRLVRSPIGQALVLENAVATEVRSLASRSADAAKEIEALAQDSSTRVRTGSYLVNETGAALEVILTKVRIVGALISEIAAASGAISQNARGLVQTVGFFLARKRSRVPCHESAMAQTTPLR